MTDDQFRSLRIYMRIVIALLVILLVVQILAAVAGIMLAGG
jgi:hypothetical protein